MKKLILTVLVSAPFLAVTAQNRQNAFLKNWSGPYGGVPAFANYNLKELKPAIETAIQLKLAEINKIALNPKPASFGNTVVALEKAGKNLSQIRAIFDIYSSNISSPEFATIESEMTPKFSEVANKIYQNDILFSRIATVYNDPNKKK